MLNQFFQGFDGFQQSISKGVVAKVSGLNKKKSIVTELLRHKPLY